MIEYGMTTAGAGSARKPAFRVLAMTPTMVTSGGRLVSTQRPRRRTLEHAEPQPRADRVLARRATASPPLR